MIERLRTVTIGEMVVSASPDDILVAYGLGSCVAICLYDPRMRVGGMLHALLPRAPDPQRAAASPARFVEQGVPLLVETVLRLGGRQARLRASLCGGARMISNPVFDGQLHVGRNNVLAAIAALDALRIPIQAQDVGGRHGRTVRIALADGQVSVRTMRRERILV